MTTPRIPVLVGVFTDSAAAERCIDELRRAGFSNNDVGFAGKVEDRIPTKKDVLGRSPGPGEETEAAEGAGIGAASGMVLGGLAAASLLIPGVGPIVSAGVIAAAVTGVAAGGAGGALVGALIGLKIPEEDARLYENEVRAGRSLVSVRVDGRYDEAQAILQNCGASDVHTQRGTGTTDKARPAGKTL